MSEAMDDLTALEQALAETGRLLAAVPAERWHHPTPCEEWDTWMLGNHLVAGNLWAVAMFAGHTVDSIGGALDGDLLGHEPAAAYAQSADRLLEAARRPGALHGICAVPYGPISGQLYAQHRFIDILVHGWDLAVASGQPSLLPRHLVDHCLRVVAPQQAALAASGVYGSPVPTAADAGPQATLLGLLGRQASWRPPGSARQITTGALRSAREPVHP